MDVQHMLDNASCAAQHAPISDDPAVVGALLRSIAQWINASDGKDLSDLLIELRLHPNYNS